MNILVYIIPLICAAIGFYISSNLVIRGRIRVIGFLFLAAAAMFWICIQLGQGTTGWDGIGYVIVALFVVVPFAIGLVFGTIFGLMRRRKLQASHD